jgi:WD40 repeat protein
MMKRILAILVMLCACLGSAQAQDQPEIFPQLGHTSPAYSVAFSPNGRILALGSSDWSITFYDAASGLELPSGLGELDGPARLRSGRSCAGVSSLLLPLPSAAFITLNVASPPDRDFSRFPTVPSTLPA